jgi:hypothetical protein
VVNDHSCGQWKTACISRRHFGEEKNTRKAEREKETKVSGKITVKLTMDWKVKVEQK